MSINPVTNPEGKAADLLEGVKKAMGSTPNIFTTFANSPAALDGYLSFNKALSSGALDAKTKEAIALAVAGFNGCDYCASAHTFIGKSSGIDENELADNLNGVSSDSKIQAALDFALIIAETRGHPNETDVSAVRYAGYSEEETIEILAHVALNTLTNYFNESFNVEVDFPYISSKGTQEAKS